ncbi:hypothetical protein FAI40_03195 [Acetobacteraceae bacterium]|nr:hypothetical protein FAI40_03195 [Acetobacteraceae bacterium]
MTENLEIIVQASHAQARASDPNVSAFVAASAGSGKTKLLIDRLLRLMLPQPHPEKAGEMIAGADPSTILCLTYTKAAAAEMQNRLRSKLAEWFGLSDEALLQALEALEVPVENKQILSDARDLLCKVLESPIGVRIETIHAFCESLLRRFPLEAATDPNFSLIDDQEKRSFLEKGIDVVLPEQKEAIDVLSPQILFTPPADQKSISLIGMTEALAGEQEEFTLWNPQQKQGQTDEQNLEPEPKPKEIFDYCKKLYFQALDLSEEDENWKEKWRSVPHEAEWIETLKIVGAIDKNRPEMLTWLLKPVAERDIETWKTFFFTTQGDPRKKLSKVDEVKKAPALEGLLKDEAERLEKLKEVQDKLALAEFGAAFLTLSRGGLLTLDRQKHFAGQLDYDDLIRRTKTLLENMDVAWVRYKLDGGLNHLLLDEVQDNALIQWKIIKALTSEFFVQKEDETHIHRTIFAVGDRKQSIYGFQGAQPKEFAKTQAEYAKVVKDAKAKWAENVALNVSFRTTKPVLSFVNTHFQGKMAKGVSEDSNIFPEHFSARKESWGRVEVWPAIEVPAVEEEDVHKAPETSARLLEKRLCDVLQSHFRKRTNAERKQPHLDYKDVLILVQKRSHLPKGLMSRLKKMGIPIVNCIGSKLIETPQLIDMMKLCEALLLPSDDFAFACFLTSPLGGLKDEDLIELRLKDVEGKALLKTAKMPLTGLWEALKKRFAEKPKWQKAYEMFAGLLKRVDYDTPFQILSQALGAYGGRAKMISRFGKETEEPLDHLLEVALEYESLFPPSLQGFVSWMAENETTMKRQAGDGENAVRFMTVHGAKGLQAPLVIVLCKKGKALQPKGFYWLPIKKDDSKGKLPLDAWGGAKLPTDYAAQQKVRQDALEEEENRLFYVAATRPADWLIIAGWTNSKDQPAWVEEAKKTLEKMKNQPEFSFEEFSYEDCPSHLQLPVQVEQKEKFLRIESKGDCPERLGKQKEIIEKAVAPMPDWVGKAQGWQAVMPKKEDRLARPLRPSQSEDGALEDLPSASSPLAPAKPALPSRKQRAAQKGKIIHRLLEFLPEIDADKRVFVAQGWLDRNAKEWIVQDKKKIASDLNVLLQKPVLAPLFEKGSRAEQPLTGIASGQVVNGIVDRLNITEKGIYLADYKTGSKFIGERSPAYRLQMALYAQLLKEIYLDLPLKAYLIWTETLEVTELNEQDLSKILREWSAKQGVKEENS